jgi:hypothetical protein
MPDLKGKYELIVAEDDLVAVHWWLQGHPGEFPIKIMRMLTGRTGPVIHARREHLSSSGRPNR